MSLFSFEKPLSNASLKFGYFSFVHEKALFYFHILHRLVLYLLSVKVLDLDDCHFAFDLLYHCLLTLLNYDLTARLHPNLARARQHS